MKILFILGALALIFATPAMIARRVATSAANGSNGSQHVFTDSTDGQTWCAADWQALCNDYDIEPYQREVFEHWAVSDWFADKLIEHGEKVDKDFAGLCVWARTTSGQAIYADGVIEAIAADLAKAG